MLTTALALNMGFRNIPDSLSSDTTLLFTNVCQERCQCDRAW